MINNVVIKSIGAGVLCRILYSIVSNLYYKYENDFINNS